MLAQKIEKNNVSGSFNIDRKYSISVFQSQKD